MAVDRVDEEAAPLLSADAITQGLRPRRRALAIVFGFIWVAAAVVCSNAWTSREDEGLGHVAFGSAVALFAKHGIHVAEEVAPHEWVVQMRNRMLQVCLQRGGGKLDFGAGCAEPHQRHEASEWRLRRVEGEEDLYHIIKPGEDGTARCVTRSDPWFFLMINSPVLEPCSDSAASQLWYLDLRPDVKVDGTVVNVKSKMDGRCFALLQRANTPVSASFEDCAGTAWAQQWDLTLPNRGGSSLLGLGTLNDTDLPGALAWEPCEGFGNATILSASEISTRIGKMPAKHRALVVETEGHRMVVQLFPKGAGSGPNEVRCTVIDDGNLKVDFVASEATNSSSTHTCPSAKGEGHHAAEREEGRDMTMSEFKAKVRVFLHYRGLYNVLSASCQSFSSWAFFLLTGCGSATQVEQGLAMVVPGVTILAAGVLTGVLTGVHRVMTGRAEKLSQLSISQIGFLLLLACIAGVLLVVGLTRGLSSA